MSALLELNDLKKHFLVRSGPLGLGTTTVRAVDGVSFHIDRGETLALPQGTRAIRRSPERHAVPPAPLVDRVGW
jgi:ABC-type antimicrobial peptide transport system ATPase subunit